MTDLPVPYAPTPPAVTTLGSLTDTEQSMIVQLLNLINRCAPVNLLKEAYYDGKARIRNMGIAVPPELTSVNTVVGWPGTAVDAMDERLSFLGYVAQDSIEVQDRLEDLYTENRLGVEMSQAILDALIFGVSFLCVGTGYADEPDVLVTAESPMNTTAIYSRRQRRITAALTRILSLRDGQPSSLTLYLPNETVTADRNEISNQWVVTNRDRHNLGRVLVSRLVNRPRSSNIFGRSEITPAVMAYTDNAIRTVLGMEVAREFYSAPQRYVLGANESSFVGPDGKPIPAWQAYIGRYLALGAIEEGDGSQMLPQVGQFNQGSTLPYSDQLRTLAQMFASETAIPASDLGFVTENPASADAIRAASARLEGRAERRITMFDYSATEAAEFALLVQDAAAPGFDPAAPRPKVQGAWADPGTPTKTAAAASTVALIQAGVLKPRSEVTYELLGFSKAQQARLMSEDTQLGSPVDRLLAMLDKGAGLQQQLGPGQANPPTPVPSNMPGA